jgi:hypothetical protein
LAGGATPAIELAIAQAQWMRDERQVQMLMKIVEIAEETGKIPLFSRVLEYGQRVEPRFLFISHFMARANFMPEVPEEERDARREHKVRRLLDFLEEDNQDFENSALKEIVWEREASNMFLAWLEEDTPAADLVHSIIAWRDARRLAPDEPADGMAGYFAAMRAFQEQQQRNRELQERQP